MTSAEVDAVLNDPNAIHAPQALGGPMQGSKPYINPVQSRERRAAMSAMLAGGISMDQIIDTFTTKFGMAEHGIQELKREVLAIWRDEDAEAVKTSRGAARRRLLGHIHKAAQDRKWTAVASLEKNLMDVEGTAAPEVTEVQEDDTTRVMQAVMEQLAISDPAQIRILIDKERIAIEATRDVEGHKPKAVFAGKSKPVEE